MKTLLIAGLAIEIGLLIVLMIALPAGVRWMGRRMQQGAPPPAKEKESER